MVHIAIRTVTPATPRMLLVDIDLTTLDGVLAGQKSVPIDLREKGSEATALVVPISDLRPWSPERPNLYIADVTIRSADDQGHALHGWRERFGVRKWEVRGKDFYLNNRPYFVRGYGDDYVYPLTLCSPASREDHRRRWSWPRNSASTMCGTTPIARIPSFSTRPTSWA